MKRKVTCFLPCRKGSERVPRKNIKPFSGYEFGLIELKLSQLFNVKSLDQVVLSTNDLEIIEYAESLDFPNLVVHQRGEALSSSATSTDALVSHALELIPEGEILWTHVTSPFITSQHYEAILEKYISKLAEGYDSLMTVTEVYGFLWRNGSPMNYERNKEKWPRTQTLTPVHEVNSGVFITSSKIYRELCDRIGERPYLYVLDKLASHDIDWPEDFVIAECIAEKGLTGL